MNLPPSFPEGERSLLGGCLLNPEIAHEAGDLLDLNDFYHEPHRLTFRAIMTLVNRNSPVDWVTLTAELKRSGKLDTVGGPAFLAELADAVPSAANWRHYAEAVKNKATLRRLIHDADEIRRLCYEPEADPKEIATEFQIRANLGLSGHESDDLVPERVTISNFIKSLEDGTGTPFRTGLLNWDRLLKGIYPGQFIVIGGRPAMGKSSLLISLFKNLLRTTDFGLALFSLEMTKNQIAARRLADACRIPIHIIRSGQVKDEDWSTIIDKSADFYDSKLFISDATGVTCSQIERKVRKAEKAYGIKFGVIGLDFLQIMASDTKEKDETKRLDSIAYGCQALAKRLDCCVIALSQLSNFIDQRPAFTEKRGVIRHGRRPTLVDIRGSGFIVAAARLVIALYRASAYEDEMLPGMDVANYSGTAEAIVRKNNDGPCGVIPLAWHAETATFRDRVPDGVAEPYMEAM